MVSLNSLFNRPGLYEVEFGIPVRHIVEEIGGGLRTGALKGVIIGGPLAGIIPPDLLDTPFGFEELAAIGASVGHGGVIAFDERTSIAATRAPRLFVRRLRVLRQMHALPARHPPDRGNFRQCRRARKPMAPSGGRS